MTAEPVTGLTPEQQDYVRANPGVVHVYKTHPKAPEELVVGVVLPEISEPKEVTRERLWRGVLNAAIGRDQEPTEEYMQAPVGERLRQLREVVTHGELLILEYNLQTRVMVIVLPA